MVSRHHMDIPGALVGDVGQLLSEHRTLYSAGHTWMADSQCKMSFRSEYYASSEEADAATVRALKSMGYAKPRWWEYWRWDESKPSERVLKALDIVTEPK